MLDFQYRIDKIYHNFGQKINIIFTITDLLHIVFWNIGLIPAKYIYTVDQFS